MKKLLLIPLLLLLGACAGIGPGFETPTAKVVGIELLPGEGARSRIGVDIEILNPNSADLSVRGMSYSIGLAGFDVLSGATDDIPTLAAWRETPVRLVLTPDWVASFKLLEHLFRRGEQAVKYDFKATLDVGSLRPRVKLQQAGTLSLSNPE